MEAVAGRSPAEVRAMVRKWSLGLTVGAVLLAVLGTVLLVWSVAAGVVVLVFFVVLAFLSYRVRKQGSGLVDMAESLQ